LFVFYGQPLLCSNLCTCTQSNMPCLAQLSMSRRDAFTPGPVEHLAFRVLRPVPSIQMSQASRSSGNDLELCRLSFRVEGDTCLINRLAGAAAYLHWLDTGHVARGPGRYTAAALPCLSGKPNWVTRIPIPACPTRARTTSLPLLRRPPTISCFSERQSDSC